MCLQFTVECGNSTVESLSAQISTLQILWTLSKSLCIHLKAFPTREKRNTTVHSWLFFISILLPVLVINQSGEDNQFHWDWRQSCSGSILSSQASFLPRFTPALCSTGMDSWTDVFLSHAFPNTPKEFNSQDLRPAGFEQPDLSPAGPSGFVHHQPSPSAAADGGNELETTQGIPAQLGGRARPSSPASKEIWLMKWTASLQKGWKEQIKPSPFSHGREGESFPVLCPQHPVTNPPVNYSCFPSVWGFLPKSQILVIFSVCIWVFCN